MDLGYLRPGPNQTSSITEFKPAQWSPHTGHTDISFNHLTKLTKVKAPSPTQVTGLLQNPRMGFSSCMQTPSCPQGQGFFQFLPGSCTTDKQILVINSPEQSLKKFLLCCACAATLRLNRQLSFLQQHVWNNPNNFTTAGEDIPRLSAVEVSQHTPENNTNHLLV